MAMPRPVRLFHITAIDNLEMICQQGALLCKKDTEQLGLNYHNIAHIGSQNARALRSVIDPPGGLIHDFVPFYFAPRSPMLSAIFHNKVQGCSYQQSEIIYFETTIEFACQRGLENFVFYDRNATLNYSQGFTDLKKLPQAIDWQTLTEVPTLDGFCKYFMNSHAHPRYIDRMEKRQAEFLIKGQAPLNWMTKIGVMNQNMMQKVNLILAENNVDLTVKVKTDWYFLGQ